LEYQDKRKRICDMDDFELYEAAKCAREHSYSPYSGYAVGAAVAAESGKVYTGCNVENSSYGATICAERNAIFKAVSEGERKFTKIAVAGSTDDPAYPCGICRQVMSEFASEDFYVLVEVRGELVRKPLQELLPDSFKLN
jgi:cytidine deaminase